MAQRVKNPPAMREMWLQSLGWEDPLEEGILQYSCLENPQGQRSLAGYSPWCCKKSDMTERLSIAQCTWVLSCVQLFVTPWTVACQAPLSMGCSRHGEYSKGLSCPLPGDLPKPGIKPRSPALQADSLLSEPQGSLYQCHKNI